MGRNIAPMGEKRNTCRTLLESLKESEDDIEMDV
jgi:hypothetical protein